MRSKQYDPDLLSAAGRKAARPVPAVVPATLDLVVEDRETQWCGAVVDTDQFGVTLEDRHGKRRVFPFTSGGFLLEGVPVTLARATAAASSVPPGPRRTASGSVALPAAPARVARASRIYVEGVHDATLVERVWGDDLRIEGVAVEYLEGIDDLAAIVRDFRPAPQRRLGVLADHLVAGSKESRIVAAVKSPHVLVTGHPYVDIWQAVKPASVGIKAWPVIPKGQPWKEGVCAAVGASDPATLWRRILRSVNSFQDLEVPLLRAVEELIDFVAAAPEG
jgi:hypothetical protein